MLFVRLSPGIPGVMCGTSPVLAGSALTVIITRRVAIFHTWQMAPTSQPLGGLARAEGRVQGGPAGLRRTGLGAVLSRYLERNGYRLGDDTPPLRPTLRRDPTDCRPIEPVHYTGRRFLDMLISRMSARRCRLSGVISVAGSRVQFRTVGHRRRGRQGQHLRLWLTKVVLHGS